MEGKANFAMMAETPVMFAVMEGKKILNIATISDSFWHNMIVARRNRGITKAQDLRGKRIAVTKGTSGEVFLNALLILHLIPKDQITMLNSAPDKMVNVLVNGLKYKVQFRKLNPQLIEPESEA